MPTENRRRTGVDAAAVDHVRIDDRDGPADTGGDAEVRRGVLTNEVDDRDRHVRGPARNRQQAAVRTGGRILLLTVKSDVTATRSMNCLWFA